MPGTGSELKKPVGKRRGVKEREKERVGFQEQCDVNQTPHLLHCTLLSMAW